MEALTSQPGKGSGRGSPAAKFRALACGAWNLGNPTAFGVPDICKMEQIAADNLLCVCLLNWGAPCLYKADKQHAQAALMGGLCHSALATTVGLFIVPTFMYQKGHLNLDQMTVLPFAVRNDDRKRRKPSMKQIYLAPK